jgi:hypothetical protein
MCVTPGDGLPVGCGDERQRSISPQCGGGTFLLAYLSYFLILTVGCFTLAMIRDLGSDTVTHAVLAVPVDTSETRVDGVEV